MLQHVERALSDEDGLSKVLDMAGMEAAVVVSVMRDQAAVGALGVAVRAGRTFSPEETELLFAAGRTIASIQ